MKAEFGEFSYGFAVTAELDDLVGKNLIAAPVFPSLRKEKKLGWDVNLQFLGISVFLQFKLADCLTRSSASQWPSYGAPYFRIHLHRRLRSRQHNLLKRLAQVHRHVYYVGPRFYLLDEFDAHYRSDAVVNESCWIPLSTLPWVNDNAQHCATYRTGSDVRFFSSQPEPIGGDFAGKTWLGKLPEAWQAEQRILDQGYFEGVRRTLVETLSDTERWKTRMMEPSKAPESRILKDITYLCRTFFGVEMVLIGRQVQ